MDKQELIKTLRQLHQELASRDHADPETRELLATIDDDIERLGVGEEDDDSELFERVEDLATRFQADHPKLANTLRSIVNTLSSMGI